VGVSRIGRFIFGKGEVCVYRFFVHLTAAVLFAHSVLGCCWHHAHTCQHDTASAVCDENHAHADHGSPGSEGTSHHNTGICTKEKCVFVRPSIDPMAEGAEMVAISIFGLLPTSDVGLKPVLFSSEWRECSPPLPVRLHLAHQVLLI
jgi:hypothetical protein